MPDDRTNKISCSHYTYEFEVAFELLSGKWVSQIIWNLADGEVRRFSELRKLIPGVTQKMLSQQLRLLERNNLVKRTVLPETPPAVLYSLTEIGMGLTPIFRQVNDWSIQYLKHRAAHTDQPAED
ncbi:MAG: helix-turn-helix transcriptional regulator [Desulfovibrionaceae bacterium]|nr:helix-turn-helix transcriptional regulator [Desulfovibrionaceae bacterium]